MAVRTVWPRGTVGYKYVIGVPVLDEDGATLNLDGLSITCKALDPADNKITPTAAQREAGSYIFDVTISAAQMTTGGAGEWWVDVYLSGERLQPGRFSFVSEAKETE